MVAGFAEMIEREEDFSCDGLQPSELFSGALQDGADSARSVASSMEGQGPGFLPGCRPFGQNAIGNFAVGRWLVLHFPWMVRYHGKASVQT
jgi:hypothetical protein